ncbi:Asparaginase/glutaminase, partial [Neohortaea acidophila]
RVLVLISGGTICMQDSIDGLIPTRNFAQNLMIPNLDFHQGSKVGATPVINEDGKPTNAVTLQSPNRARLNHEDYDCSILEFQELIDSSSMDGSHWTKIATTLQANWHAFDAFVVLHGTDTLAYTASILSFVLGDVDKTVIVTGSQLSMYAPHNDAHDNLLDSLTFAANFDVPEVSVVFHHHLYRATRVTKVSSFSLAAFTTPNARPLAIVRKHAGGIWTSTLYSKTIQPVGKTPDHDAASKSGPVSATIGPLDTNRVAVLKVYPGISTNLISHIAEMPDLRGLVLETFGAGNVPLTKHGLDLLEILSKAIERGIVVVSVTQCLTGSVTSAYESARRMERRGIVTGLDMTTEAAYTKLVYLLSLQNLTHDEVANMMRQDLCRELT